MTAPAASAGAPQSTPSDAPGDWLSSSSPSKPSGNLFADTTAGAAGPSAKPESYNPYATPTLFTQDERAAPGTWTGEIRPTRLAFDEVLSITWQVFSSNLGTMAILGLILFVVIIVQQVLNFAVEQAGEPAVIAIGKLILVVAQLTVQVVTTLGGYCYCLQLLRTGRTDFDAFMQFQASFWQGLLKDFLIALASGGLVLLCLIPVFAVGALQLGDLAPVVIIIGVVLVFAVLIYFALSILVSGVFLVDRRMGAVESIQASFQYSAGNRGTMFGTMLVVGLVGGLFTCCTLYLGAILFLPYISLLTCVMYLLMTGQRESIVPQARGRHGLDLRR